MTVAPVRDSDQVTEEMRQPWLLKAACTGLSGLLADPEREQEAKDLCVLHCPVKVDCARHVFSLADRDDPGGVVAGWTERRRMAERHRRRINAANQRKRAELERLRAMPMSELAAEVVAVLARETGIPATRRPELREVPQVAALPEVAQDDLEAAA